MRDVAPGIEQPATAGKTEMIDARVGERIVALRIQRNIHRLPIHRPEHAAVRDHGDAPSPRPRGDYLERRDDAVAKLRGALSLGRNVVRVASTEFLEFLRKCALDPGKAMTLKNAVVALAQRNYGVFEGHSFTGIESAFPEEFEKFRTRDPHYVPPEGESAAQFRDRVVTALEIVAARTRGRRVAVVTHGGVLGAMYRQAMNIPLDAKRDY